MGVGEEKAIFDEMSLSLLMYNISQNGIKFAKLKSKELTDIGECYYLLKIYYSERELSQKDDELLKLTSYVEISKYREKTLKSIGNNVKIPTNIAKDSGIRTNHISKVLSELKSKEIVECINEEARKGRLYRLTDTGKEVLESINEKEEEN